MIYFYYLMGVLSGVLGILLLKSAWEHHSGKAGFIARGISFLAGGVLTIILMNWWPLALGWLFALVGEKIFGKPADKR